DSEQIPEKPAASVAADAPPEKPQNEKSADKPRSDRPLRAASKSAPPANAQAPTAAAADVKPTAAPPPAPPPATPPPAAPPAPATDGNPLAGTGDLGQQRRKAQAAQGAKNGTPTLDLVELKDMSIQKLNQVAKDMNIAGAAGLRKQELIFKILQ